MNLNSFIIEASDGRVVFYTDANEKFIMLVYSIIKDTDKIHESISWLCRFFKLNQKQIKYTVLV